MKLALYDTTLTGHHGAYLCAISAEADRRNWRVTVVLPKGEESHIHMRALRSIAGSGNVVLSSHYVTDTIPSSRLSLLRYHLAQRRAALASLAPLRGACDFVYAPNIDYMDMAIQLLGTPCHPTPFGGTRMRARFHMSAIGVRGAKSTPATLIEEVAFHRLLANKGVACVTTADPSFAAYCAQQPSSKFRKVKYIPEIGMRRPPIQRAEARTKLGFEETDRVILVYGAITKRKAVEDLLEAIKYANIESPQFKVLVVGSADDEMRIAIQSRTQDLASRRLTAILRFADAEMEDCVFAASDAVWVAYKGHNSMSGVFYQARCCGLPVIAPNYGILDWLVEKEGAGIVVDPDDPKQTGIRLASLLTDHDGLTKSQSLAATFALQHSPEAFGSAVCDAIQSSLTNLQDYPASAVQGIA